MTRNTALAATLALPLLVAACGTPQERCISNNTSEYRTVSRLRQRAHRSEQLH